MELASLQGITGADQIQKSIGQMDTTDSKKGDFDSIFKAAVNMIQETDSLEKNAESESIRFALGEAENTHDLQIAQYKANYALMYTNAVRNKEIEAYKEIMNIQI